jgi:isochorismate synthase
LKDSVYFSLPGNEFFETIINDPDGGDQFIWRAFAKNGKIKSILGRQQRFELTDLPNIDFPEVDKIQNIDAQSYQELIEKAIRFSGENNGKVVLSRINDVSFPDLNLAASMLQLKASYKTSLVYLLISEVDGVWLGATPETLVNEHFGEFETMALAGTKWNDDPFEEKEFFEQQLVVDSIVQKLKGEELAISEREESVFGAIRHLKSQISWVGNGHVDDYAELLHPTPAICGFPQDSAYQFILETEKYNRNLYTGYLGLKSAKENSHLFVNLRCMQLFRGFVRVYAGGGINQMSDPASEWEETTRKMNTVLNALKVND